MKKKLTLLLLAVAALSVKAQNVIPNNGFEQWTNGSFNSFVYTHPQNWTTAIVGNFMTEIFGMQVPVPMTVSFGEQSSDAHSGSYALKLKANTVGIPGYDQYSFTCPGIAQLGDAEGFSIPMSLILDLMNGIDSTFDFSNLSSLASLAQLVAPGDVCTVTPRAVKMWVKYLPVAGDSMTVMAFTKLGGNLVSTAQMSMGQTLAQYTQIEVPFDDPLAPCDSICIIVMSGGATTSVETELYIDDVELDFSVGVENHTNTAVMVYPNPATDVLYVQAGEDMSFDCQLYDVAGRMMTAVKDVNGTTMLSVGGYAPGVYLLRVNCEQGTVLRKVVIR